MTPFEVNNLASPYTAVTFIRATFPNGSVYTGSGVMVGPNDVLTAAHLVYSTRDGGAAIAVEVIPGFDASPAESPFGSVFASYTNHYTGFDPDGDGFFTKGDHTVEGRGGSELDLAIVSLSTAIGDRTGWMTIDPSLSFGVVEITGYPAAYGLNPISVSTFVFEDPVDYVFEIAAGTEISSGNSGGPLWYYSGGSAKVVGVVSTSGWGADVASIYDDLTAWMSQNDFLIANADRLLNGGSGNDQLVSGGGNDTLYGYGGDDGLVSGGGNDALYGQSGNDSLYGQAGSDALWGDAGNDWLDGGIGVDSLDGGPGNDTYFVTDSGDSYEDSSGYDTLLTYVSMALPDGFEVLTLQGAAPLYAFGNSADNVINGNDGANPFLRGLGGSDYITGGNGNDSIDGESGDDALPIGHVAGNDSLHGGGGNDTIRAGDGDDYVTGGAGTDFLIGEGGNDLIYGGSEWDAIDGRSGSDSLLGEGGNDIIFGDGLWEIFGYANDYLIGGEGNDTMMGESGSDSTLGAGDILDGGAGNDFLDGGGGDDYIAGGAGNDVIDGDHGSDYIVGGGGADIMAGSAWEGGRLGNDLFAYTSLADGGDQIFGFDTDVAGGIDRFGLKGVFDSVGYQGSTARLDGVLHVHQNGANTDIYVDADGNLGSAGLTHLATLHGVSALSLTDDFFLS